MTSYDFSYYLWEFAEDLKDGAEQLKDKGEYYIENVEKKLEENYKNLKNKLEIQVNHFLLNIIWSWWEALKLSVAEKLLGIYLNWDWSKKYFWNKSIMWHKVLNSYYYRNLKNNLIRWLKEWKISNKEFDNEYIIYEWTHLTENPKNTEKWINRMKAKHREFDFWLWISWLRYNWYIRIKILNENEAKINLHISDAYNFHKDVNFINDWWLSIKDKEIISLIRFWKVKIWREFDWELNIEEKININ